MTTVDYLVVGSGLTGSTIARLLHDRRCEVLILERRLHLGGNVHDFLHASKIRAHTYGPHYFRCSSEAVWQFVNRFSSFYPFEAKVKAKVEGQYAPWPVDQASFRRFPGWEESRLQGNLSNFEAACLQKMPRPLYEMFVAGYTRRQWGMEPRLLDPTLARRIRVNHHTEACLTPQRRYQALPRLGYSGLMSNMVAGIPCLLGIDYLEHRSEYRARKALIFTGSLDEFFGFNAGRLGYRSQKRVHEFLPGTDWHQPCAQVNHPDAADHEAVRTIEWKHLMPAEERQPIRGTLITREYPFTPERPQEFEYPVPTARNRQVYEQYHRRTTSISGLIVCGRLGAYRYFDMDQAIGRAMQIARRLLAQAGLEGASEPGFLPSRDASPGMQKMRKYERVPFRCAG